MSRLLKFSVCLETYYQLCVLNSTATGAVSARAHVHSAPIPVSQQRPVEWAKIGVWLGNHKLGAFSGLGDGVIARRTCARAHPFTAFWNRCLVLAECLILLSGVGIVSLVSPMTG